MSFLRKRPSVHRACLELEMLERRDMPSATAIGMNLERVTDYSAGYMFTDAFKASRPWVPMLYNTTTHDYTMDRQQTLPISIDARGWPTQLNQTTNSQGQVIRQTLSTMMLDRLNGHYPAGTYTAQWDGTGTVHWGGDAQVAQLGMTPDGHHFANLNVTPGDNGIGLDIWAMNNTDPIHNIHVWMPASNGQSLVGQVWHPGASFSPFYPLFVQRLQPFGTLRFMQTAEIIPSQVRHWSDRRAWDYATQSSDTGAPLTGIAPEYIVELCNEEHANAWINIPHQADDDYVRHLATFVRDNLNPGLKVYLEWSNEVWNRAPGFAPYQWVTQQLALPENAGVTFAQFVARENRRVFDIWSQVFAQQPGRLVRVVAGFENGPGYTRSVLSYMNGEFDAIAPAAYFGPSDSTRAGYTASTTVDQVLSDLSASIPTALSFLRAHKQLADMYSAQLGRPIQLLTYEGGPGLEGHHQVYQTAFNAAAIDPRIYNIYRTFLVGANQVGVNVLVNFEYTDRALAATPYGIYGALNYLDEPVADAPRYHALLDAANGSLFAGVSPAASAPAQAAVGSVAAPVQGAVSSIPAQKLPVLMVIANQAFYYREYNDTRLGLLQAGFTVQVAAGTRTLCQPMPNTGQGSDGGYVMPDVAVTTASAANYSAIIFIGGWGTSEYQYAFPGTYSNPAFNGTAAITGAVNRLINDFVHAGKYVTGICHGVTVLAWARVDGVSPLAGHSVTAYNGTAPPYVLNGVTHVNELDRLQVEQNGAHVFAPNSIGDPHTAADDVFVDGQFITGQNYDSALLFGQVLARQLQR